MEKYHLPASYTFKRDSGSRSKQSSRFSSSISRASIHNLTVNCPSRPKLQKKQNSIIVSPLSPKSIDFFKTAKLDHPKLARGFAKKSCFDLKTSPTIKANGIPSPTVKFIRHLREISSSAAMVRRPVEVSRIARRAETPGSVHTSLLLRWRGFLDALHLKTQGGKELYETYQAYIDFVQEGDFQPLLVGSPGLHRRPSSARAAEIFNFPRATAFFHRVFLRTDWSVQK